MKLFYCHIPSGNFGDELNAFLWPRLLPDAFSGTELYRPKADKVVDPAEPHVPLFVGIGTLIRREVSGSMPKHVFGSGFGYGTAPDRDGTWQFHCVRGPLTAQALGLEASAAITDPGMLVRLLVNRPTEKVHRVSFIPHWEMAISGDWERVCRLLGINYIDPRWEPRRVIGEIAKTNTLITEALHGAIVADALRVPWIPVSSRHTILRFKWEDWCRSVGLAYAPKPIPALWVPRPGFVGHAINKAKEVHAAVKLSWIAQTGTPMLSGESVVEHVTDRLLAKLDGFCRAHRFTLNPAPQF